MNPELWRRTREIFDEALDRSPEERSAYVVEASDGDQELKGAVERLLAKATEAVTDDATGGPADGTDCLDRGLSENLLRGALARGSMAGRRIGEYQIRDVLGSGGMATVFEAEQQRPHRTVALKIMRNGFPSEVSRRRFEYESEVLASLRHPAIAQVFAVGTHKDRWSRQELPYFAMEFVEGARSLERYVEEEGIDLETTLGLFVDVCQAVHHGHQRGVIHRDLKPPNILVDVHGRPKVIDFGIARAVDPQAGGQTLATREGEILGTLHYMSPEQVGADPGAVDLRGDVYSLGVILFQLVAGRLPFDMVGVPITTAITTIQNQTAPAPSSCGGRFATARQAADLDLVILEAMEKDPDRRYASAAELAADLERILADEPIVARPPSRLYLANKFVRRHRVGVVAASIALVSLIAGTSMAVASMIQARTAEEKAIRNLAKAVKAQGEATAALVQAQLEIDSRKAVNDLLTNIFSSVNPYADGREVKVIDLLDRASAQAEQLYANRPPLATVLHVTLGSTYLGLDEMTAARDHLERAVALGTEHLGVRHSNTLWAMHTLAICYMRLDRAREAAELASQAYEGRLEMLGPEHQETIKSLLTVAAAAFHNNELERAETGYRRARESLLVLMRPGDRTTVQASSGLGMVLMDLGRTSEAEEMLQFALDHGGEDLGSDHPSVLNATNTLAMIRLNRGELEPAAALFERVLETQERVLGKTNNMTLLTLINVASAMHKLGRCAEAESHYGEVVARQRAAGQYQHHTTAMALGNLGVCLESRDRLDEAEEKFDEALALLGVCRIPKRHWLTAAFRKGLAVVRTKQGRHAEAETTLLDCVAIYESNPGDQTKRIRKAREALVALYDAWGKAEQARQMRALIAER